MVRVIGVRFRTAGKVYFFSPGEFEIKRTDHVIVETARGVEYGTVVGEIREVEEEKVVQPLKPVIRIATDKDDEQQKRNAEKEKEALAICKQKIAQHSLDMKLIDAEYTFDNNKVLFYFTSDGRVDFRELVKDLAGVFRTRIELRQIGVRDETKIMGGIGICGRTLCCHTHLPEFAPVSIKMAKEQGLSLNPTKISGMCGRLMCCLKNEEDTYEYLNRRLPNVGDMVTTPDGGKGEVHSVNVLRQLVKVLIDIGDEKEIKEYPVDELRFKHHHHNQAEATYSEEELKELRELEQLENRDKMDQQEENKNDNSKGNNFQKNSGNKNNNRNGKANRENKDNRDNKDGKENRDNKQVKDNREIKEDAHQNKEYSSTNSGCDGKKDFKNNHHKPHRNGRDSFDNSENQDGEHRNNHNKNKHWNGKNKNENRGGNAEETGANNNGNDGRD